MMMEGGSWETLFNWWYILNYHTIAKWGTCSWSISCLFPSTLFHTWWWWLDLNRMQGWEWPETRWTTISRHIRTTANCVPVAENNPVTETFRRKLSEPYSTEQKYYATHSTPLHQSILSSYKIIRGIRFQIKSKMLNGNGRGKLNNEDSFIETIRFQMEVLALKTNPQPFPSCE